MNLNWGLLIIIIIIIIFVTLLFYPRKESFTVEEQDKLAISRKVSTFVKPNTDFIDYLKFLVENNNKSYILINQDTFYEIRILSKNNRLTTTKVYDYIKNEK